MSDVKNYSFMGRGLLRVRAVGTADPLQPLGNASSLKLSISESKVEQKNYMTVGGGVRDSISRVDSAEVEISLYDLSPLTLAMALRATRSEHAPETVTDEEVTITSLETPVDLKSFTLPSSVVVTNSAGSTTYVEGVDYDVTHKAITALTDGGISASDVVKVTYVKLISEAVTAVSGLIETQKLPDENSIIVTSSDGSTTYLRGTDYTVSGAGIEIVDKGDIKEGTALKLHYAVVPSVQLEALAASGVEFYGLFTGLNEARGGSPVNVRLFRLKFSPTDGLDLISDEYGQITLKGSILADTSRPAGTSQYFSVAMAKA